MTDLKADKTHLRKDIRDQLRELSPEQKAQWSDKITSRLLELPEYQNAKTLMIFLSFAEEYDTFTLIPHALSAGKTLCAPRVDWDKWVMEAIRLEDLTQTRKDAKGLMEPAGEEQIEPSLIDLALVPGLAFDVYGHRLGRGGGFYDRFLARADLRAVRLAPTFDFQIRPAIPFDSHDQTIDILLSPTRLLRFSSTRC